MKKHLTASIAAGLLIAGCGGGDDEDGLSKAEFLKQGNAICKKGNEKIDAGASKAFASPEHPTKKETTAFAEQTLVPSVQGQIDQLRDLSPPEDDEAQLKSIFDQAQAALDKIEADPQLLGAENTFEKVNRRAKNYGLTACA